MLSRLALRNTQSTPALLWVRGAQTSPPVCPPQGGYPSGTQGGSVGKAESNERDLVNFPRPVRPIDPAPVRHGFIPEGWFEIFYKKTGATGPYAFGIGLITYLCSKEIYVMEHEFYSGLSLAIMAAIGVKKLGPGIAKYADKEVDQIESDWKESRHVTIRAFEAAAEGEKKEQWRAEGQTLLFAAKKENVAIQLESAYRERIAHVFSEVKRRLDYQVETQNINRRINQKHMVQWIISGVLKSITPQQEKESLQKCIADLRLLAVK